MKNIQEPITINAAEIIARYGAHYFVSTDTVYEQIGQERGLFDFESCFLTLESAKNVASFNFKLKNEMSLKSTKEKISSLSFKLYSFLNKLNLINEENKTEINNLKNEYKLLIENQKKIENGTFEVNFVRKDKSATVPKYMPEVGKTYYHIRLDNVDSFVINECDTFKIKTVYDTRTWSGQAFKTGFDLIFDFFFIADGNVAKLNAYELINFNGVYWELENDNEYLFLNKEDAQNFINEYAKENIASLNKQIDEIAQYINKGDKK